MIESGYETWEGVRAARTRAKVGQPTVSARVAVRVNGTAVLRLYISQGLVKRLGDFKAVHVRMGNGPDEGKIRLMFGDDGSIPMHYMGKPPRGFFAVSLEPPVWLGAKARATWSAPLSDITTIGVTVDLLGSPLRVGSSKDAKRAVVAPDRIAARPAEPPAVPETISVAEALPDRRVRCLKPGRWQIGIDVFTAPAVAAMINKDRLKRGLASIDASQLV